MTGFDRVGSDSVEKGPLVCEPDSAGVTQVAVEEEEEDEDEAAPTSNASEPEGAAPVPERGSVPERETTALASGGRVPNGQKEAKPAVEVSNFPDT